MKNNATAESKEYNRLFVVSVQSHFRWPIQVPSFWNNVNFSVHCSAFVDLVPLVEIYLVCLVSTVMGGRHRSLLPCTVGWQVWVWWKPHCNVHCIFFFQLCHILFVYTSDSAERLLYFRTSAKAFQKKLLFPFKNNCPKWLFYNATCPKGNDLKIASTSY